MACASFRGPREWDEWSWWLMAGLRGRNQWRLPVLLMGFWFAQGRRTVSTWPPAGGIIRVVLVKEDEGWAAFFRTDPNASVREVLEAFADRAMNEQNFHDQREVWGTGQQQVRDIGTNVAVFHLHLWVHPLVECWAWHQPAMEIGDRSDSPWDDADRRPSRADRRNALRPQFPQNELNAIASRGSPPRKIVALTRWLAQLAT